MLVAERVPVIDALTLAVLLCEAVRVADCDLVPGCEDVKLGVRDDERVFVTEGEADLACEGVPVSVWLCDRVVDSEELCDLDTDCDPLCDREIDCEADWDADVDWLAESDLDTDCEGVEERVGNDEAVPL